MNLQIRHYGRIKNGKLIFDIPSLYDDQLRELEGQNVVMHLKKRHEKPSVSQYGYYRGAILVACYESDMFMHYDNKDQIHELYFAPKFLSYVVLQPSTNKEIPKTRSLADLTKEEMSVFMERVLADCAENGIEVPLPELFYNKYYQK